MNRLRLEKIDIINGKRIIYHYSVAGEWAKYFSDQRSSFIEYDSDISCVPDSVLAIPFVCNILPALWLCDAELFVNSLDGDFLENLPFVKDGYCKMYPMLNFGGKIHTKSEKATPAKSTGTSACFFSGGVDAHTTLFRHLDEKPDLVTIWGCDVKLSDKAGWDNVMKHVTNTAETYGVNFHGIKSDFRGVLQESKLGKLVRSIGSGWWVSFQHSISIISHAAPLAFVFGWEKVFIASSITEKIRDKFPYDCVSVPSIDGHLWFCGCRTIHDGYELERQQKVAYLVKWRNKLHKPLNLRVCWESEGGENCSHCEKCYRTILELVSEGADPNEYGFFWRIENVRRCKHEMLYEIKIPKDLIEHFYLPIQRRLQENRENINNYEEYRWLVECDFSKFNDIVEKRLCRTKLGKMLVKIVHQ